jgi:hypothetical protein
MKASEILRKMADMIDAKSQPEQAQQSADHAPHTAGLIPEPNDTFLPPLQSKLELLKKAVGVENVYDENAEEISGDAGNYRVTPMEPDETDALERMKKAAGISAFITSELSDDEPLES